MNIRFHRGPRRGLQFWAAVWMALALGTGLAAAQPMSLGVMRDFSVPDFHDPPHETQLRWLFKGAEARPQTGGLIWVREITLQQFQTNGQRELLIESPECIFNSGTREASSSQALRMQLQDGRLTLAGEGFYWQATNSLLVISNQVQTTVRGGWLAATAEGVPAVSPLAGDARVEADEFIYNHSALLATYHRNVRATSTNFHLTSEQLTFNVPAEAGGTVEALVAEQNVALEFGAWQARGDRAVYTPSNGWLHLTGAVTWRAETREGSGDTVLLDGAAQRLDVQGNARLRLPVTGAGLVPQQAPAAVSGDETNRFVTITATRYELQTNHARFEGGVNVTERAGEQVRGRLTCGTLQIALGGTNQVQDLVAEREVVIEQETRRLTGQRMDYDAATGEARLTGQPTWQDGERHGAGEVLLVHLTDNRFIVRGGAQLTLPGADDNQLLGALVPRPESTRTDSTPASSAPAKSVQITSETYELSPEGAVFQGDVRVDDAQMQLTCERLTVTIAPDGTNVANIVADGNVVMNLTEASGAASTATCARAVYTAATEQLEFSGQPVVDRADGSRFAAEKIVMDRATGKLSALGQLHFQGRWSPPGNESQSPRLPWEKPSAPRPPSPVTP